MQSLHGVYIFTLFCSQTDWKYTSIEKIVGLIFQIILGNVEDIQLNEKRKLKIKKH